MEQHRWRERTDDGLRFFRADHHAGRWTIWSQLKGDPDWTRHDPIPDELWRTLRDVLWRKYQRRRCPWEMVDAIDRLLEPPPDQ
jgi:hypothetical protein